MGDVKRQYRPNAADTPGHKADPGTTQNSWEVRQRGSDFDVVRPVEERRPAREHETKS